MEIGTTRSGTVIEFKPQESIAEFRKFIISLIIKDRFDLYTMLQVLAVIAKRRYGEESDSFEWWRDRLNIVADHLTEEEINQERLQLGLKTSYDFVRFGAKLLHRFWRELL